MHIVLEFPGVIPALKYGGTERVIWYLGRELTKLGHKVTYMVKEGSSCDFADIIFVSSREDIIRKMPAHADIINYSRTPVPEAGKPYVYTLHGNTGEGEALDFNTIFISKNHAQRYGSVNYIYNGLDWDDYGKVDLQNPRSYFHFLGNASWRVKNVRGAIEVIKKTRAEQLKVLGGHRVNFKMGFRFTLSRRTKFYGMVGGQEKNRLLQGSKGLVFPVRWHEPFGLAIIESLYFGCPVFGTPYGSLPELVPAAVGFLTDNTVEMASALEQSEGYSRQACHDYAVEEFNAARMARAYLQQYERVLNGEKLNATQPRKLATGEAKFLKWV